MARHSPKSSLINRKVRRSIKSAGGIGSKARYYAIKSKQRYSKRHPAVNPGGTVKRKRSSTRSLNMNPLRKVMKEAGAKKVRVMRNRAGKPTGVKFLR
jgi:hypothetical protein